MRGRQWRQRMVAVSDKGKKRAPDFVSDARKRDYTVDQGTMRTCPG